MTITKITKIRIKKVLPQEGLVGFASCVLNDFLYLGNIAIFSRLNRPDEYRIVFPIKEKDGKKISLFYPLTSEFYFKLESAISDEYKGL